MAFPELSKRELAIIKILWDIEKGSVREVHNKLIESVELAYPTTKTMLDRMVEKKYLKRENLHGIFVYSPLLSKPHGIAQLVKNFMENVLEVDNSAVTSLFTNSPMLDPDELKELQQLINKSEEDKDD